MNQEDELLNHARKTGYHERATLIEQYDVAPSVVAGVLFSIQPSWALESVPAGQLRVDIHL